MDEKLAKGLTKRFLNELLPPMEALYRDIDNLCASPPSNQKNQRRTLQRLEKKHSPLLTIGSVHRSGGQRSLVFPYWMCIDIAASGADYVEKHVLSTEIMRLCVARKGVDMEVIAGPLILTRHALQRMAERDLRLPTYSWKAWLRHLQPAFQTALLITYSADPSWAHRPIALPTRGGLFVAFLVGQTRETTGRHTLIASCHSFYGQHELNVPQQKLHADFLVAKDEGDMIAIHEAYGWDKLWAGTRPKLLRVAEEARLTA